MARGDPHSVADLEQPRQRHLHWRVEVDFAARRLACVATLHFDTDRGGPVDLDTRGLEVDAVSAPDGRPLRHALEPAGAIVGTRLRIELPTGTDAVMVRYRTGPEASALQWLAPGQTSGAAHPFLYSQCQAIHARSVVPLQDTPRLRITYDAELTVPGPLRALMAAGFLGRSEAGGVATERWRMEEPIPPYLLAFAVGALGSRELGPRSRIWAEPAVLDGAAWEFAAVDRMLTTAEALLGPYDWGRYDLLVLPPSFPYGGMENPRLTFLTPTVITGDRSLVNVVAHELAHSWTGNLVSNASAEHFWLNEGFTVFVERRLLEALEGPEAAALHAAVGRQSLESAVAGFADRPELTRLRTNLQDVDPDDAFSQVPYEKGFLFLRALEDAVGREAFDGFLRKYMARWRFQSITTEEFLAFLAEALPQAVARVDVARWVHGNGIPEDAPAARSSALTEIASLGTDAPDPVAARSWPPLAWQVYLNALPRPPPRELVERLEQTYALSAARNPEVLVAWLTAAVRCGHPPAVERTVQLLGEVGRMKYLKPLYTALATTPGLRERAETCFRHNRARYHTIAAAGIASILRRT